MKFGFLPQPVSPFRSKGHWRSFTASLASGITMAVSLWVTPAMADPFRTSNPHTIGPKTEAAFDALFEEGNYPKAAELLKSAEPNEPMAYAMKASLAYLNSDWDTMAENANLTLETAQKLVSSDPLRGNLYIAAGYFLQGAHTLMTQGAVRATPTVLGKLQQVFDNLGQAEKLSPEDPELNLIKGFMDLILAVNLPFANPDQAIQRLRAYAAPSYLSQRGIAIGYRDLENPDQALVAVNQALQSAPKNPELFYLKAQILRLKSDNLQGEQRTKTLQESVQLFRQASTLDSQLPDSIADAINREGCRAYQESINKDKNACRGDAVNWKQS